jgi:hypothetical protein
MPNAMSASSRIRESGTEETERARRAEGDATADVGDMTSFSHPETIIPGIGADGVEFGFGEAELAHGEVVFAGQGAGKHSRIVCVECDQHAGIE